MELDGLALLALAIVLVTHFVGAITAFGSSLMAVPPLLMVYGPESLPRIVFILIVVGFAQSAMLALRNWRRADARICILLLAGSAVGLPLGLKMVSILPQQAVMLVLGIFTLAAGLASNLADDNGSAKVGGRIWAIPFSLLSGIMQGAFASGGTILVIYAQRALPDRDTFRATLAVYWTLLNLVFVSLLVIQLEPATGEYIAAVGVSICVLLITLVADRFVQRIERKKFQRAVSAMLVISGCVILASQVLQ